MPITNSVIQTLTNSTKEILVYPRTLSSAVIFENGNLYGGTANETLSTTLDRVVLTNTTQTISGAKTFESTLTTQTVNGKHFLAEHISGGSNEFRVTYGSTVDMALMIGSGDANHGLYDTKAGKWMIFADGNGNVQVNGNTATATALATARTINGTSFNGTANITTANWGTARNVYIADSDSTNTSTAVSVNGSANITLKLPATIKATLSGNAATATKATQDGNGNVITSTYVPKSDYELITIQKTLTITTSWQNTGIQSENLSSGTYIIQMSGFQNGYVGQWNETYSGILTWYNGGTNSSDTDDIVLHKAGHASNGASIFLRTARSPSSDGKFRLQIKGSSAASTSTTVTFKFRRVI